MMGRCFHTHEHTQWERWSRGRAPAVNRGDGGSIHQPLFHNLRQFRSPHICLCLLEETLKAGGPFYLVSMSGEVKDPTWGKYVTHSGLTNSREGQL